MACQSEHIPRDEKGIAPSKPVLVVDDEPSILFAYKKLILGEGFQVDTSETLDEALALINCREYGVVITDIRLSGSDNTGGIELLQNIRKRHPATKVIVVTGFGSNDIERTLRELGASHYFEKPVQPTLIIELLKTFGNIINREEYDDDFGFGDPLPLLSDAEGF